MLSSVMIARSQERTNLIDSSTPIHEPNIPQLQATKGDLHHTVQCLRLAYRLAYRLYLTGSARHTGQVPVMVINADTTKMMVVGDDDRELKLIPSTSVESIQTIYSPDTNVIYGSRAANDCIIQIRLKSKDNPFGVWSDVKKSSVF